MRDEGDVQVLGGGICIGKLVDAILGRWNRESVLQSMVTCTVDTHVTCISYSPLYHHLTRPAIRWEAPLPVPPSQFRRCYQLHLRRLHTSPSRNDRDRKTGKLVWGPRRCREALAKKTRSSMRWMGKTGGTSIKTFPACDDREQPATFSSQGPFLFRPQHPPLVVFTTHTS